MYFLAYCRNIRFVELTQATVQYLILKLNLTMGTAAVCSLFPLIIVSLSINSYYWRLLYLLMYLLFKLHLRLTFENKKFLSFLLHTLKYYKLYFISKDQPLAVKGQFVFSFLSACERFYISAWSANDLSEMVNDLLNIWLLFKYINDILLFS